jgi:two-component system response regulator TtrR
MPILSGDEVQEHLLSKNCPLPVIFLTGHGDMNLAIHTFRHGAFDFIQKPFDPDYLFAVIEKAITNRERRFKDWKTEGPKEKFAKLTYRQKQVLTDISKGVPSRFIADHLNISIRTVERHRQNGMRICGVKTTQELIEFLREVKTL